ncbi:AAA family ATPase [Clostridioides sp. ZZV14-6009]|uniref:AAA family ATPase n=1 Tax=Clostridioides sp. ZZV14-6009 TaxID=2811487 RepID=UPI001D10A5FD|nr:AAA family ATPase [Clostridioides sp. ZZV14-6009]
MNAEKINQYIRSVKLNRKGIHSINEYPFNLPIVKNLYQLEFHKNVTFIIGENGSGKSTLLEAIAIEYGFNPEGGTKNFGFSTYNSHSELHKYITITKGPKKPKQNFFLRAESFYNVATAIDKASMFSSGVKTINYYGGVSLHEQSHGESFFSLFIHKFSKEGIYILDEPEAALSPARQMAFITRLHELVTQNCQFIIATHSPILICYPNSIIYEVNENGINKVKCEDSKNYQLTQDFLNHKEKFLNILID